MKRIALCLLLFIMIIVFGTLGPSKPTAQHAAPTKTASGLEKTAASPNSGPSSRATAVVNPLKIDPKQPSNKYMTKSAFRYYDREKVEVVARSVTFPNVIRHGEHLLSVEFPSAGILCLDAAYYAGRVQGLILAMDRDTVEEHKLFRTIDDAQDLFDKCLISLLQQDFADQNKNGNKIQLKDVREELAEHILIIQEALKYARDVKINAGHSTN